MGVLVHWASKVQETMRRDESLPLMASVSGLAILLLGVTLHGVLVAQKGDLVPLFDRALADGERSRVARVLEEECAAYVFSPGMVLVSRRHRGRVLERLAQSDAGAGSPELPVGLLQAKLAAEGGEALASAYGPGTRDARAPAREIAAPERVAEAPRGRATTVPVVETNDGSSPAAGWTLYNLTCDDEAGAPRRPAPRDGIAGGR